MILLNPGSTALNRGADRTDVRLDGPLRARIRITLIRSPKETGRPLLRQSGRGSAAQSLQDRRWPRQTGCFFSSGFRSRPAGRSDRVRLPRLPALPASL